MAEQQDRLYAAEAAAGRATGPAVSAQDLQYFVDGLRELPWWDRTCPQVLRIEATVVPNRKFSVGAWQGHRNCGVVEMLPEHLNQRPILHEVSHVIAAARYGSHAHDPWFARTYLELVALVMGPEAYLLLVSQFDAYGIDYAADTAASGGAIQL